MQERENHNSEISNQTKRHIHIWARWMVIFRRRLQKLRLQWAIIVHNYLILISNTSMLQKRNQYKRIIAEKYWYHYPYLLTTQFYLHHIYISLLFNATVSLSQFTYPIIVTWQFARNFHKFKKQRCSGLLRPTVRAPVFGRHQFSALQSITEKPMEVYYLDEWIIITLHVAGFLHPAIF